MHAEDVDEPVEMVAAITFTQIDKGPFAAEVVQTELTGVLLSAAQYGRSLIHTGEPPSRNITFAVGMSRLPARWQGHDLGLHDLRVLLTSGAEIDLVTQAGFCIATASFPLDLIKATVDGFGIATDRPRSEQLGDPVGAEQGQHAPDPIQYGI